MCDITRVNITPIDQKENKGVLSELCKQFDADALFSYDNYRTLMDGITDKAIRSIAEDIFDSNYISVDIALSMDLIPNLTPEAESRIQEYGNYYIDPSFNLDNELGLDDLITAGEVMDTLISMA